MNFTNYKKTFLLLFILIFPSAVYVYLTAGRENSFVRLPYYGPKRPIQINKKGKVEKDTVFYSVPSFDFYNQKGEYISAENFKDKIWVCCFKHLKDDKIAPSMAILMNRVEERTNLDTALKIVTFTLDSESVSSLSQYALMVHAGKKQLFLSGKDSLVKDLAINGFYQPLDTPYTPKRGIEGSGFIYFFLIDREGCFRGIYNGLVVKEVDNLIDNISELETAYHIKENHYKKGDDEGGAM